MDDFEAGMAGVEPKRLLPAGEIDPEERARLERLDALGESLSRKRGEAIAAREQSGIEEQWVCDEEFYQGIDDANRDEHRSAWSTKPPGQQTAQAKSATRSTVFPNITRPYCDAAAARIADMLLPTDDRSWAIKPTPIPDLVSLTEGKVPQSLQMQLQGAAPEQIQQLQQQAVQAIEEAKDKADKAQTQIEDWNVQGQWHAEVRKVIEDASRCGTGVLKGPFPVKRKSVALVDAGGGLLQRLVGRVKQMFGGQQAQALVVKEEIEPTSKRIDFWNLYPDGSCGENIHAGSYIWERDYLTARQLLDLKGTPGYIDSQIDLCIAEGPKRALAMSKKEPDSQLADRDDKRYEIWYYHGTVEKDDMQAAGCDCGEEAQPQMPAMVAMVNSRVIKAALNPLDSGDYPYDVMPWQRKSGLPWGNGVARQGRTAQRIVTAATRHLLDNAGLAAGPQIIIKQGIVTPADGQWSITPRKVWFASEDADMDDVRKAMAFLEVPSQQQELEAIIQLGMKLMEDSTGLPMLLQGQQGKAPDTVGGMTMLNNNASAVLRRLARLFDDCITEPHIRRYYTWLLQYGPDDCKGDFTIDARGSSALVERDMQSQQMPQLLQASGNPVFGIDPKKCMEELLKSWHLDPKRFQFDDQKWQQIVTNLTQHVDPRVQAEQLRAQAALQGKQLEAQAADQRLQKEQSFESSEADKERNLKLVTQQILEHIEQMKLTGASEISFEELKAELAGIAMKVSAQKELSAADLAVSVHKHHVPAAVLTPPSEPVGRAQPGQAFQQ